MHHSSVSPDLAVHGEEVADIHGFQFGHDRIRIIGAGSFDGFEVVHGGRVGSGLIHRRHRLVDGKETLGKVAGCLVTIPIEARSELHPLSYFQTEAFYVGIEYQQPDQFLPFLVDTELPRLFYRVGGIAARHWPDR